MITVRKSQERGHANHGWLDSYHTFSFANYYDPRFVGFQDLLVINQDIVEPGQGFGTHGHRDMEIITYVLDGALEHKDSMGNGSVLQYGDVQRMSAGTGVRHSEFNHSSDKRVHLLQIWITPGKEGIAPGYEEKNFSREEKMNRLRAVVSSDGKDGSLHMNQDATLYASILEAGKSLNFDQKAGRHAWIQVISGSLDVGNQKLEAGDGAAIADMPALKITAKDTAEFLLFDLR